MKLVACCAVFLLCFLVPATTVAQSVQVEWDHGTDFSRLHTFTWATAAYPIQDPDANLKMAQAVQDELAAKGVQYVDPQQKFDIFVTYNAEINPDPQDSSRMLIALRVRIFDAQNNTVIWRAGGSLALVKDRNQNRSKLRALLDEMFQKYPPPK